MRLSKQTQIHLRAALKEDIGSGDVTSRLTIPAQSRGRAEVRAREAGVFCGETAARFLARALDRRLRVNFFVSDGQVFKRGKKILALEGPTISILELERTLLNFLAHLSGVATKTNAYVQCVKKYKVSILDTRKTTPLWRQLEKNAVVSGGGKSHRRGLYDQVFVKENHRLHGNLAALKRVRGRFVIEVRNAKELQGALRFEPKVILLDNFTPTNIRKVVTSLGKNRKYILLEASGGITLKNVAAYARAGVDRISVGALTHSVKAIDFSLLMKS